MTDGLSRSESLVDAAARKMEGGAAAYLQMAQAQLDELGVEPGHICDRIRALASRARELSPEDKRKEADLHAFYGDLVRLLQRWPCSTSSFMGELKNVLILLNNRTVRLHQFNMLDEHIRTWLQDRHCVVMVPTPTDDRVLLTQDGENLLAQLNF